jgi:hypothetical protein
VSRRRWPTHALCIVSALATAGLTGGCGETPQTVPEGTPTPEGVSLSCVERSARDDPFVAAVETVTPRHGPLAGASRYHLGTWGRECGNRCLWLGRARRCVRPWA